MKSVIIALALTSASGCMDSASWHKKGNQEKDCAWVADFLPVRCAVKGLEGVLASDACASDFGVRERSRGCRSGMLPRFFFSETRFVIRGKTS